jgi:hypothetical protein
MIINPYKDLNYDIQEKIQIIAEETGLTSSDVQKVLAASFELYKKEVEKAFEDFK